MMSFAVVRFLGLKLREWCRLETKSKTRQAVVGSRHRATRDFHVEGLTTSRAASKTSQARPTGI